MPRGAYSLVCARVTNVHKHAHMDTHTLLALSSEDDFYVCLDVRGNSSCVKREREKAKEREEGGEKKHKKRGKTESYTPGNPLRQLPRLKRAAYQTNPQPTHICTPAHLTKLHYRADACHNSDGGEPRFCLRSRSRPPPTSLKVKRAEPSRAPLCADLLTHPAEDVPH